VIAPSHEWVLPEPFPDPPAFTGFGRPVATLLARRGFTTDDQLGRFLSAGVAALHPISLMTDADVALDRLERAIDRGERIAIWGDYDADGMTAVAVWVLALRAAGAEAIRYVPSRLAEGYGLSAGGLDRLALMGVSLIVTCDCGIGNVAEVEHAAGLGIDVVVTDHHLPGARLPQAVAVVDPHRSDCTYPDADLTGAGLAYKLGTALLARRGMPSAGLAAIAAVGTMADMAPMVGESRAIVRLGLEELSDEPRAGLRALLSRAADDPARPTARDLAFGVAPRINAAGRIADAELAISLLLEEDPAVAERIADELEAVHRRRRELTATAVAAARAKVPEDGGNGPIALRNDDWAPGIVSLVAGRLTDLTARPVAVATRVGDEVRGSVRAPADFAVSAALDAVAELLTKRGGHAGAGGFSLVPERWDTFAAAFAALPRPYPPDPARQPEQAGRIVVDLVLPAAKLGWELVDQIERLAPFGPGHAEPVLAVTGLRVGEARRVGQKDEHVILRMRRGAETFDAVAFATPEERPLPETDLDLDLVGTLERDDFGGMPRLRLRVIDYAASATSPLAARRRAARQAAAEVPAPVAAAVGT
jgi:single-stranded-DNA-specific exonuclease